MFKFSSLVDWQTPREDPTYSLKFGRGRLRRLAPSLSHHAAPAALPFPVSSGMPLLL